MRTRLGILVLAGAAAVALSATTPANAGDCNRLIHATIQGVGHVCLGPDPVPIGG